ncbi:MAG: metallophosphoesterase [Candidatus Bathyarchaeia archaeon]
MAASHDNLLKIKRAVEVINDWGADLVVHCGDFSAPFAASPYKDLDAPMIAVYGNNDAERGLIREKLEQAGKKIPGTFAKVEIDNRKIAVTHGDNIDLLDSLIESQVFDAVIYGHSHQASTRVAGGVLALNPGEVCGYLTGRHTFATLDTASMKAKIIRV